MDYFKYTFNENEWTIYIIEDDDQVLSDEGNSAEVHFDNKEVYFKKSEVNLKTVLHEIWHIYFAYCYLSDTNDISISDLEEISAALFSDKAEKMIEIGKDIYNKLKVMKSKDE